MCADSGRGATIVEAPAKQPTSEPTVDSTDDPAAAASGERVLDEAVVVPVDPAVDVSVHEVLVLAEWFGSALGRVDLGSVGVDGLGRFLAAMRVVQRRVDAAVVRGGVRADELAGEGLGPGSREALLGSGQVRGSTARRESARARLAARSGVVAAAMGSGEFGPDHLDAMVRRFGRLDDDHLGRIDLGVVLDGAERLPADTFDSMLRRAADAAMVSAAEDEATDENTDESSTSDDNELVRAQSEARHWFDHRTGLGHLSASLDPERYEAMANALDQHTTSLANSLGEAKNANLAAQALVDLVCSSGERQEHLPHVTVVVDQATLERGRHPDTVAETGDGHGLSTSAVARLCCDAIVQRLVFDRQGLPVDVGRRFRTATPAQWVALRGLYSSCAWAGCDRPISHCQAHHIRWWRRGGATDLHNLVPLCSHHHHLVHEGRWHIELLPDRGLRIVRPDGTHHATTSPPTRQAGPPGHGPPPPLAGRCNLKTE